MKCSGFLTEFSPAKRKRRKICLLYVNFSAFLKQASILLFCSGRVLKTELFGPEKYPVFRVLELKVQVI